MNSIQCHNFEHQTTLTIFSIKVPSSMTEIPPLAQFKSVMNTLPPNLSKTEALLNMVA